MEPTQLTRRKIYRGDNEVFSLKFELDTDGVKTPYDLTVWAEIVAQFRLNNDYYSHLAFELSTTDGNLEIAGDNNERLIFNLSSANTKRFNKPEVYNYDVKFIGQDGEAQTLLAGEFEITLNITNR